MTPLRPYYQDEFVTLYCGDAGVMAADVALPGMSLVSDPPYPNNAGWFVEAIPAAKSLLSSTPCREALVFWSELERPPVPLPLVAVHVWHRTNVNGRPYESVYHFDSRGEKRRSDVIPHAAVFGGVGPGCWEYLGHPTQKPADLMRHLILKTSAAVVFDPFAGSGTTLLAAKSLNRRAIGIEIEERYCEIAAQRLSQNVLDFGGAA